MNENHRWNWFRLRVATIKTHVSDLGNTCHFPELPCDEISKKHLSMPCFTSKLKKIMMVPRLMNKCPEIHQCRLIEAFLGFLLQLLSREQPYLTWSARLENLEIELRCLLAIAGDISWTVVDHEAQFLADFEAVANEVGCVLHSWLFPDPNVKIAAVLNHIYRFKSSIQSPHITSIPLHPTPRTSVVNSIPILNSLVDDLHHLLKWEDSRIADMKDQINLLHKGLRLLQHSLISDVRSPQPSEIRELKLPLMYIGDIASRAESLINKFLVKDAPFWYVDSTLTYLNTQVERIGMEIQVIITQKFKFGGLKVKVSSPLEDDRKKGIFVGFEDKETQILDQLVGGGTKSLQVISILGMAGLGKTTLAKKLYNHDLVRGWFDRLSWSVISQTHERQSILAHILIQINSDFSKDKILKMEGETLIEHIYKTLKGRRYFVVMDDIWDSNVWYELQRCFPEDGNGSRILLTGRIKDAAPPNSMNHELPLFSNEQCWELLEKKVFGSRTCPSQLQQIGKDIAEKCHGLPLMVVVIAGVLSTVDNREGAWEEVRRHLASYIDGEENSVMEVIELSYKHLSDHLKPCFLHFGLYVEDEEISVRELKRLWIAEGFIRRETEKSKESVAEEYLMELIDRNLVMVGKRRSDSRGVKTCVLHDLLRDLCLKKCEEESFLQYLKNDWHNAIWSVHRLRRETEKSIESVSDKDLMEFIHIILAMDGKRRSDGRGEKNWYNTLRSGRRLRRETDKSIVSVANEYLMELIDSRRDITCGLDYLFRDFLDMWAKESFLEYLKDQIYIHRVRVSEALEDCPMTLSLCRHVRSIYCSGELRSTYVGDMISLRVLHFRRTRDAVFFGLEYLANLRYLVIDKVPACMDKLLNLEYIRLYSNDKLCIPPTIVKLKKLRYFGAWKAEYGDDWSSECESNSVEYLSGLVIKSLKDEELLRRSPHLLKLRCSYEPEMWNGESPRFDLSFLNQLASLSLSSTFPLHWVLSSRFLHHRFHQFGFPPNIRKLSLRGSDIPIWKNMSIIGKLEKLEVLKLKRSFFAGKRWETRDDEFQRWETRDGEFQKLRFLLFDNVNLFKWNVASSEHFPQLRQLILIKCYNLQEIPSEIGEIATLELIEVREFCQDSMLESAERIKREQREMENEELRVLLNEAF